MANPMCDFILGPFYIRDGVKKLMVKLGPSVEPSAV